MAGTDILNEGLDRGPPQVDDSPVLEPFLGWKPASNGIFSVQTAYEISSGYTEPVDAAAWKEIWKLKGPQRLNLCYGRSGMIDYLQLLSFGQEI